MELKYREDPEGACNWRIVRTGKVREILECKSGAYIALVASDAVSAFDKLIPVLIPDKGRILTDISAFWFNRTEDIVDNAMLTSDPETLPEVFRDPNLEGRVMIMRKLTMLPVEAIVRGYITGSLWQSYDKDGLREFCGLPLSEGLRNCEKLPDPLFTPTTKAPPGEHDENLSFDEMIDHLRCSGFSDPERRAEKIRDISLELYRVASEYAVERGLILADTKFEFGLDDDGNLVLADELLTPDSSRYWPLEGYAPDHDQPSFDKQIIRDYISAQGGSVTELPPEIIAETKKRYEQCRAMLIG